ncbi:MAG: hypothetical protein K2L95_01770 [Alphaproteobacteria bacterium]|nr:hypothetical protein [Alphaproteobacteria bacterium]
MKSITRFLLLAMTLVPCTPAIAAVSTTAGSNLTAFNGNIGAMNNNAWNQMMNTRGTAPATADFGNCNSVILRCAQPKCATGGCTTMEIAAPIVSGCVMSNDACKQYGDDLIQYISAQLVANSTAKANAQAAAAQNAAAQAAAQQSAQQLQQMQAQMQQMQSEMASANAAATAQLQAALEEQKQLTAQAIADAAAAQSAAANAATVASVANATVSENGLSDAQMNAASGGVSADILAREQIAGQIMTSLDNAAVSMKELKATMENAFQYAGCDNRGNNCTGPKRVKMFKQKALNFFDPYENVLDEVYDALIMAQSVGVDITDIYMMLNGTCNAWAKYLCSDGQVMHYTNTNCQDGRSVATGNIRGGARCAVGQVVPMSDGGCQLIQMLTSDDEVQQNWLYPEQNVDSNGNVRSEVRVGCASEALDNSMLFRGRKKQATIDIETLQRIIEQDAPSTYGSSRLRTSTHPTPDGVKFCAVNPESLQELQKSVSLKQLPKKVCVTDKTLVSDWENNGPVAVADASTASGTSSTSVAGGLAILDCSSSMWANSNECKCRNSGGTWWGGCVCPQHYKLVNNQCEFAYGTSNFKLSEYVSPLQQNTVTPLGNNDWDLTGCGRRNGTWRDNKCWCGGTEMGPLYTCTTDTLGRQKAVMTMIQ